MCNVHVSRRQDHVAQTTDARPTDRCRRVCRVDFHDPTLWAAVAEITQTRGI